MDASTRRMSNSPLPLRSMPASECGGANTAGPIQDVKEDVSLMEVFHELRALTVATSQLTALEGISTFTTNAARLPDVRFPVSGTPSPSVSGSETAPPDAQRVAVHEETTVRSKVSLTLVPVFVAVTLYHTVSPGAPFDETRTVTTRRQSGLEGMRD